MDCVRVLSTRVDAHVSVHCLPYPVARHGDAGHDDEHAVLLDGHCGTDLPSLAYLRIAQRDEVGRRPASPEVDMTDEYRRMGYEFFKATHFAAVVVFMIVFFWHCDYTLTSW